MRIARPVQPLAKQTDGKPTADCALSDGACLYTWDAENRLIGVAPAGTPAAGAVKLRFAYDHTSRRVRKTVWTWTAGAWALTSDLRFVYDGWNVIEVLDAIDDDAVLRQYTWGLDLSGLAGNSTTAGIHGAGGIGGLLACEETGGTHEGSYWFLYDAMGDGGGKRGRK